MSTKICYTINGIYRSGVASYPDLLDNSLLSLSQCANTKDIIVIYAPPYDEDHITKLKNQGYEVQKRPEHRIKWRSSMKLHLCDVDYDNLVFLDADTIIYNNPIKLLEGDFTFAGRPDPCNYSYGKIDLHTWINTFVKLDLTYLPLFGTGFLFFKNQFHKKIKEDWLRFWDLYFASKLPNPLFPGEKKYAEMLAFTLAVSKNLEIEDMRFLGREHISIELYNESLDVETTYAKEIRRINGRAWDEIQDEVRELVK